MVTFNPIERINYSEYELPGLDEQDINEEKGLDPEGITEKLPRNPGLKLNAKWKLEKSPESISTGYKIDTESGYIAGRPVDLNDNGTIEATTKADFWMRRFSNTGELAHTDDEKIPPSVNDWNRIVFRGGAVGGLGVSMSGDIPILISRDMSQPMIEELTVEESISLDLIGNPDDCTITSIMPDILFTSSTTSQSVKITITNLFGSETTATLEVKSALLDETFSASVDLEPHGSADVLIPVKQTLTAGDHTLECVLTCANNMSSDVTQTIHVLSVNPFTVEEGGNLNIDGSLLGGCTPVIEDTSTATMSGAVIYGVKAGQTFMLLKNGDETVCTVPVYVTAKAAPVPDPEPDPIISDDPKPVPDPIISDDPKPVPEPTPVTSDDPVPAISSGDKNQSPGGSGGGCDSGFAAVFMAVIALSVIRRR